MYVHIQKDVVLNKRNDEKLEEENKSYFMQMNTNGNK